MADETANIYKRSNERLRYAVDVCHKAVNDAFKIFSLGKRPYHQLISDVCQDINAQLDTLNLLIQPLLEAAPKYDFEGVEGNGIRSVLGVVDCILKELISHLQYCSDKHNSFFFNGTNCAAKLARFCTLLSRLGKLLDIATLMHQNLGGKGLFLEVSNPVGALCMREMEGLSRECFYGQLVGLHYNPAIRNVMKGICVALSSFGIGYYTDVPNLLGQPQSLLWRGSASVISGAKFWFKEEERSRKFVELTHNCASIDFTKSFWNLVDNGPLAEVPKMVNKGVDIAVEIYIEGEPLYVRNRYDQMILMHPPVGKQGHAGVTIGFLSSRFREGQVAAPPTDPEVPPPPRFPKSKRLLLHFHGGGFVSGSHVQHEAYLRGWCRELDAVVVSVNYSLAPDNPFPKGLDDCIFAYAWCLENLHTLGCTGKSIVFMGDSAGGNLALATAMRANSYGLRPPDGIVIAYPVTYVKYAGSVSRLLSALDILLPSGVLQCCLRAYSGVPVDSNTGFSVWMQTAHQAKAPEKPENHQTISELNSKYISDICGTVPKYTIPAPEDMPSLSTPTPEPTSNNAVSPDPTISPESDTPPEDHTSPDTKTPSSDNIDIVQNTCNPSSDTADEQETADVVEQINIGSGDDREDASVSDLEEEPVELDTIRINPVVFDHVPLPEKEVLNKDTGSGNEDASPSDENDRIVMGNYSSSNGSKYVMETSVEANGDIVEDVQNGIGDGVSSNAVKPENGNSENDEKVVVENDEPNMDAHSSYILLDESRETVKVNPDPEHLEPEESEHIVDSERVISEENEDEGVIHSEGDDLSAGMKVEENAQTLVEEEEDPAQPETNEDITSEIIPSEDSPPEDIQSENISSEDVEDSIEAKPIEELSETEKDVKTEIEENTETETGEMVTETEDGIENDIVEDDQDLTSQQQDFIVDETPQNDLIVDETVQHDVIVDETLQHDGEVQESSCANNELNLEKQVQEVAESVEAAEKNQAAAVISQLAADSAEKTSLGSRSSQDNVIRPNDKDLERMLYDDNETRFKGAKLVLTPDNKTKGAVAITPGTPVTPNKTMKEATLIRDEDPTLDVYPEPAYVINPGEIATRKNATLLQKYFDDPFMSPYLADSDTLAALPPVHVVAAEYDPLLDDAVAFCRKMKEAGGSVSLEVVPGMTHGFLNLVVSNKTCAAAAKLCLVAVSKMFDKGEEQ